MRVLVSPFRVAGPCQIRTYVIIGAVKVDSITSFCVGGSVSGRHAPTTCLPCGGWGILAQRVIYSSDTKRGQRALLPVSTFPFEGYPREVVGRWPRGSKFCDKCAGTGTNGHLR